AFSSISSGHNNAVVSGAELGFGGNVLQRREDVHLQTQAGKFFSGDRSKPAIGERRGADRMTGLLDHVAAFRRQRPDTPAQLASRAENGHEHSPPDGQTIILRRRYN